MTTHHFLLTRAPAASHLGGKHLRGNTSCVTARLHKTCHQRSSSYNDTRRGTSSVHPTGSFHMTGGSYAAMLATCLTRYICLEHTYRKTCSSTTHQVHAPWGHRLGCAHNRHCQRNSVETFTRHMEGHMLVYALFWQHSATGCNDG